MKINNKNIQFIFCSFIPVGLEDYVNYFINNFEDFIYLKLKFPHGDDRISSQIIKYKNYKLIEEHNLFSFKKRHNKFFYFLLLPINYIVYLFQSIKYLHKRQNKKIIIFMGINYFCTFCGIILKKFKKVDFVIYRVMDFFPIPKNGFYRFLNKIFHLLDKFCLKNSDFIWFTTEGHIIGREKYKYFNRKESVYQMVPLTVNSKNFVFQKTNNKNLIYCGVVSKYHMFDMIFEIIKELKKTYPDIKLKVLGSGPDLEYYKEITKKQHLNKNIIFYGYVEEGKEFNKLMSDNLLGFAFYKEEEDFMKYTEPAKVKYYLNFDIPVLISDVPKIAKELHNKKVSFCLKNSPKEIVKTIDDYIKNPAIQMEYRNNIKNYIKTIDVNFILDKNFKILFNKINDINYEK